MQDRLDPVDNPQAMEGARQRRAFVAAYAQSVSRLTFVDYVFYYESPTDLEVFTIFHGDRWAVRPQLYSIEAEMLARFPKARIDIRALPADVVDLGSLHRKCGNVVLTS